MSGGRFNSIDLGSNKTMERMVKKAQDDYNAAWNEAIEAAIKFMVTNRLEEGLYDKMRKELKK